MLARNEGMEFDRGNAEHRSVLEDIRWTAHIAQPAHCAMFRRYEDDPVPMGHVRNFDSVALMGLLWEFMRSTSRLIAEGEFSSAFALTRPRLKALCPMIWPDRRTSVQQAKLWQQDPAKGVECSLMLLPVLRPYRVRQMGTSLFVRQLCFILALTSVSGYAPASERSTAGAAEAVVSAYRNNDAAYIRSRFSRETDRRLPNGQFFLPTAVAGRRIGLLIDCAKPVTTGIGETEIFQYPCSFTNTTGVLTLVWNKHIELEKFIVTPTPALPTALEVPANVQEQMITTGAAGWPLTGTLTISTKTAAKTSVALILPGSGKNDQDGTAGPNKPYRDIALGLASHGIASYRYQVRRSAYSERFVAELPAPTLDDEVVADAVAAIAQLQESRRFGSVFIVGHSEGAWLAPRVAMSARRRGIKIQGLVMVASPAKPLVEVFLDQYKFQLNQRWLTVEERAEAVDRMCSSVERVRASYETELGPAEPIKAMLVASGVLPPNAPRSFWADLNSYDPASALAQEPDLALFLVFGLRDWQVTTEAVAAWKVKLQSRSNVEFSTFARLNHQLMNGDGPATVEEYSQPSHVPSELIDEIAAWIIRHQK